MLLLYWN